MGHMARSAVTPLSLAGMPGFCMEPDMQAMDPPDLLTLLYQNHVAASALSQGVPVAKSIEASDPLLSFLLDQREINRNYDFQVRAPRAFCRPPCRPGAARSLAVCLRRACAQPKVLDDFGSSAPAPQQPLQPAPPSDAPMLRPRSVRKRARKTADADGREPVQVVKEEPVAAPVPRRAERSAEEKGAATGRSTRHKRKRGGERRAAAPVTQVRASLPAALLRGVS
jgi:hypothetical protein